METLLSNIAEYADSAHGGQMRKYTPERYIVHPVRVMKTCERVTNDFCILAAALLHDVLEDTVVTKDEMKAYLKTIVSPEEAVRIVQLVGELTDVYVKKDYPKLNRRARKDKELQRLEKTSPDSQTIKYADIIDNTHEITTHDPDFAHVFLHECRANLRKLNKGNKLLYDEAVRAVDDGIAMLKKNPV